MIQSKNYLAFKISSWKLTQYIGQKQISIQILFVGLS